MFFTPGKIPRSNKTISLIDKELYKGPVETDYSFVEMSDSELVSLMGKELVYDIECYPNYFLIAFKSLDINKVFWFEQSPDSTINTHKLSWVASNFTLTGFNNKKFDDILLGMAIQGRFSNDDFHQATKMLIEFELQKKDVEKRFKFKVPKMDTIDLIEVAPLEGSLKLYTARIHARKIQDLPYDPQKLLTQKQALDVRVYCINDLDNTELLRNTLSKSIALRIVMSRKYKKDLRSKSNAQIAESVLNGEIQRLTGEYPKKQNFAPGYCFKYEPPEFIEFKTEFMQNVLAIIVNTTFKLSENNKLSLPETIANLNVSIGETVYNFGMGGLHSTESSISRISNEQYTYKDNDVASYYPRIILNNNLYPENIGPLFLEILNVIVEERLAAKEVPELIETANSLKIVINGTGGKFNDKYSKLNSPKSFIQMTLTGQLSLLMLIETLELHDVRIVSANTDGIVIQVPTGKEVVVSNLISEWMKKTGFTMEETEYIAVYSRDVNSYMALKPNGKWKLKGAYAANSVEPNKVKCLEKNPTAEISILAVCEFLSKNIPIEQTINECQDITKFVSVRVVKGGAVKDGVYIGKVVRWYYKEGELGTINYKESGNKVSLSDGAWPLMVLPDEFPKDVDKSWYIRKAYNILEEIGYLKTSSQISLF